MSNDVDIPLSFDHRFVECELKIAIKRNIGGTVEWTDAEDIQSHELPSFELLDDLLPELRTTSGDLLWVALKQFR